MTQIYFADGGKTTDHLHIVYELLIAAEDEVQTVLPELLTLGAWRNGRHFSDEVLRRMISGPGYAFAKIISSGRRT